MKKDSKKQVLFIVYAAVIAALYVVLTYFISAFNLASGAIQVRISEALTILPFFTPAAIPGLFVGCLISNLITGCAPWDVVFGSLATLLGAVGTYLISRGLKHSKLAAYLAPIPPIVANTIIVPFVLAYVYGMLGSDVLGMQATIPVLMLSIFIGEVLSCGVLGLILLFALKPNAHRIFQDNE